MGNMKVAMIFEAVDKASRVIDAIMGKTKRMAAMTGRGFREMTAGAARFGKGLVVAGGIIAAQTAAFSGAAYAMLEPARQFERFETILTTTEGSAQKARDSMAWVETFATKTPYELDGVMEAFVRLRAYGLDPTNGLLRTLGDTSAAMGKPMMQAVEAIADAVTGENERLKEFGIKARAEGKYFLYEYTQDGITKTVKALKSDRAAIEAALTGIFAGKYGGAMDRLSGTFDGMWSNVMDNWTKFERMIMDSGPFEHLKTRLADVLDMIDQAFADGTAQRWAEEIGRAIVTAFDMIEAGVRAAIPVLQEVGAWLAFGADLLGGWGNLAMAILALPFASTFLGAALGLGQMAIGIGRVAVGMAGLAGGGALRGALLFLRGNLGVYRLLYAAAIRLPGPIMAIGRASIFLASGAVRGAISGTKLLARGLVALPGTARGAALGLRTLATALVAAPARLMAFGRAALFVSVSGLKALPGLVASAARSFVMMAGAGLARLPGLLMAAGRAFVMFGMSLMTTPIGWFLAGVAAIAAIAYLIYANWEPIKAFFVDLWASIKSAFSGAIEWLSGLDWSAVIPDISWDSVLTVLDWASWILPVRWLDLIPGFSWKEIITSVLEWADFIPDIDWSSLFGFNWADVLPDWDWSAIIPDLPSWASPSSWFSGADEDPAKAVPEAPAPKAANMPKTASIEDPAALREAARLSGEIAANQQKIAAVDTGPAMAGLGALEAKAATVANAVQAAMDRARSILAATDFTAQGARIMETLAAGLRSKAAAVVAEIRKVTQAVRDHLPSSPAKVGPLSDLHRLKFAETIAASIRPDPMVRAMRAATAAALVAAAPIGGVTPAFASPVPARPSAAALSAPGAGGGASGGAVTVNYAPVVNISGGAGGLSAEDIRRVLSEHADELVALIERTQARRARLEF